MGEILLAGEKPHEGPAALRNVVPDGAAQHWIASLQRVQDGALRDRTFDLELHLSVDACQRPQMSRKHDSYHGSVWTSTESTDGRSRTMADQLSPLSTDA
jgi:hypothetical protein